MVETNQDYIDQLITFIEHTTDPDSITNVMVAAIFASLNSRCKNLLTFQSDLSDALSKLRDDQRLTQEDVNRINTVIDSILGENASDAIDNFREILAFLDGVKDTESLVGLLDRIRQSISTNTTRLTNLYPFSSVNCEESEVGNVMPGTDRSGYLRAYRTTDTWRHMMVMTTVNDNDFLQYRFSDAGVYCRRGGWDSDDNVRYTTEWMPLTSLFEKLNEILSQKADRNELSNILGTPTEEVIEEIEPGIVTDALRKVPQVLTPEEQAQVRENIGVSKMELFIDIYNAAFKVGVNVYGKYDPENAPDATHVFRAYDLWLTYEEAVAVMNLPIMNPSNLNRLYHDVKTARTHRPTLSYMSVSAGSYTFNGSSFEVIEAGAISSGAYMFYNCRNLRLVNIYSPNNNTSTPNVWDGCIQLEDITFSVVYRISFSLKDSPLLSLATMQRIVSKTSATGEAFTITVHPDVYAKLTDESNTEWHQVLLDAAEKNINFATV